MSIKLLIPGAREPLASAVARGSFSAGLALPSVTKLLDAVEVVDSFNLSGAARSRAAEPIEFNANDDDILEMEVEGGFTLWTSAARYRADLELLKPEAIGQDGRVSVDKLPRTSISERGIKDRFQGALRILRLKDDAFTGIPKKLSDWPAEFVTDLALGAASKPTAWLATKLAMWKIESQLSPGPGLYRWEAVTEKRADGRSVSRATFDGFDTEKPILVFIHGTASSTLGSFGAFLTEEAQAHWRVLLDYFDGHIYAFEHRTMSESPIDNALHLVSALPPRAKVFLVSHSRGGLIGDLICLKKLDTEHIAAFQRKDFEVPEADEHDRKQLEKLAALIAEKELRVERFVRCAAPARGTLLAGENLDTFLSVLTNLVGLIPGIGGNPLYEVVKRVALQIVKNRTDPELVPGIEAMMPSAPLVALLNAVREEAGGALGVVAGDIEGGSWLKSLGVFLTDHLIYEARDNDLVVNTDSMFHGARRAQAYYVFDQGSDVSHFNYFRNKRTRAALIAWFAAKPGETPLGFRAISEGELDPVPMLRSMQARSGAPQPVVFVLPGIMGSNLRAGDSHIWVNYLALLAGELGELSIDRDAVQPVSLIGNYYQRLCRYLTNSHEVIPFAYDWRRSSSQAAKLLAGEIEKTLDRSSEPVRIIAHSSGGLVARSMMMQFPALWERICEREGGRCVLLGTPHRGSHAIVEALLGTATTVQHLARLDRKRSTREIANLLGAFPGVLELLPNEESFFETATWRAYSKACKSAVVPSEKRLAEAKEFVDALRTDVPPQHADRILCVAGSARRTINRIVEIVNGRVVLEATTQGDGRVTYESGRLPEVAMWYMDAQHGELANHPPAFPAIVDLLERGTTTRLSVEAPTIARGDPVTYRTLPEPVLYPTAASLTAGLMGQPPRPIAGRRTKAGFCLTVVHGDLRFSRYPIVVGHYEGDTIIGAEAQIDRMLAGALSDRYNLGIYPGAFGSLAVVLRPASAIQQELNLASGAVVLGLGKWGELTTSQLADLIRRGALQYLLQLGELQRQADTPGSAGLSVLLIGANSAANISIEDSVAAIMRGIAQANREIDLSQEGMPRIGDVEIVELYADAAIHAAHAARHLAQSLSRELDVPIEAAQLLERGRNGRNRLLPSAGRAPWRRWEISVVRPREPAPRQVLPKPLAERLKQAITDSNSADGVDAELLAALSDVALADSFAEPEAHRELRFLSLSDRARAEVVAQQRQPELIERLINASVTKTSFGATEARALFELMIPNDLKDGLSQLSRVVLVVDEETANYPWELMHDGVEPLCARIGMVRQLQTAKFRSHIRATTTKAAYVVGDPLVNPPYRQLAGARAEAEAVAAMLRGSFNVTLQNQQPTAVEVLGGLFEKPYRIIHLAGHGQFESPRAAGGKARSGLVLDNGVFLTAVEICQMQQVPELVFLNCCHIGKTGPQASGPSATVEFNRLAASVSRELIEMGVRAVVAAGWAVRDDAALHFAKVFYDAMLNNETFGRALLRARRETFMNPEFRDCNTWGAYQAYGDPDFQLNPAAAGLPRTSERAEFVSPTELIEEIKTVLASADGGDGQSRGPEPFRKANLERVKELVRAAPAEWLAESAVLMSLGLAHGGLGQFERAIHYLRSALDTGELDNATTLRAVEQLANFQARYGEAKRSVAEIYEAVHRLQCLNEINETAERLSLIGGAYKRITQLVEDPVEVRKALEQTAAYYRMAHERNLARGVFDPYPVLNWLTASALLKQAVPGLEALLSRGQIAAAERYGRTRETFDAIACTDLELVRAFLSETLAAEADSITERYQETFTRTGAAAREIDSVLNQLRWMQQTLERLASQSVPANGGATAALDSIRTRLSTPARVFASAPAAANPEKESKASSKPRATARSRRKRGKSS